MKRFLALFIFLGLVLSKSHAQEPTDTLRNDSSFLSALNHTSLSKIRKKEFLKDYLKGKIKDLNDIDTAWISPNYYNYAFMIQNTSTFESFTLRGDGNAPIEKLEFSPTPTFRLGAYFGWRWLFLGYTFDVKDIFGSSKRNTNQAIDLSIYTSKIGFDLYYRKTGNDYKIRDIDGTFADKRKYEDTKFNGLNYQMKGLNVYYIFNHRKFSFPAAFSQSTEQRRSCGSLKLGFSYSHHKISFDHTQLPLPVQEGLDEGQKFSTVNYSDYNISFGYSYNWVFKRNWLLAGSFTPAVAYTHSHLEQSKGFNPLKDLKFKNMNVDFISRIGLVYNNAHHFGGLSLIIHSFNYKKNQFSINNSFGSLNFYVGLNFLRKKEYRKD